MVSVLQRYPFPCLTIALTEKMKEPDDQDTEVGRSERSKSSGSQSRGSSQTLSKCK